MRVCFALLSLHMGFAMTAVLMFVFGTQSSGSIPVFGMALSQGFGLVYTRSFLKTLKLKADQKLAQFPGLYDRDAMLASRTMYEFDNVVTAPLHGFRDAHEYWTRATVRPLLREIVRPTLLLNARNDPFLPAGADMWLQRRI